MSGLPELPQATERTIEGLRFVLTCEAVPEQYDVFDQHAQGAQVAYVRLRSGYLSVDRPDVGGETIFHAQWPIDRYKGDLHDAERAFFLPMIALLIRSGGYGMDYGS